MKTRRDSKLREPPRKHSNDESREPQIAPTIACLRPVIDKRSIFPFLELPPELRNSIYEYSMPETEDQRGRDLATLYIPAISRVSRQLRQESIGYVFENRAFDLCVGTNISHRITNTYYQTPQRWDKITDCGTLGLNPTVRSFLKQAAKLANFKDIIVNIYESVEIQKVRYRHRRPFRSFPSSTMVERERERARLATIHLFVKNGKPIVDVHRESTRILGQYMATEEQIEAQTKLAIEDARKEAQSLSRRADFSGWTTRDLHKVAKALYWKEGGHTLN